MKEVLAQDKLSNRRPRRLRHGKNEDIFTHLLALNHACAEKEKNGDKITPPGLPLPPAEHAAFITTDCIEAPQL